MAITHYLLESNFNSIHLRSLHSFPTKRSHNLRTYSPCCIKASPKLNIKCFVMNPRSPVVGENRGRYLEKIATDTNDVIWRSMETITKALQMSVLTAVLSCLLFLYDHHHGRLALAASGGSMGGDSFSSSSDSYSCSSSSSSSSDSDSSWSSSSHVYSSRPPTKAEVDAARTFVVIVFVLCFIAICCSVDLGFAKTSVLKLQVGSLATGRSLQKELNQIAEVADTSNSKGFHFVLQESILALLRHSEYCISGYSSVDVKKSVVECKERFSQISIEERGKFDEETLVNINNIKKKSATSQSSNGLPNEYIVVTFIVAARGKLELPPVKNIAQLKEALQKLASIPSKNIMGAHVLWTPQKEDDSFTKEELLEDYPLLRPL